jgi:mono/diheme cytochrome c family protein
MRTRPRGEQRGPGTQPPFRQALLVAAALVALSVLVAGCGTEGLPDQGNATRGKELFTGDGQCGSCHVLADARTPGKVGPNLDDAFAGAREEGFKKSTIAAVVLDQIHYPTEGSGMPANLVTGEDAEAVAAYVADVAGDPAAIKAAAAKKPTGKGGKADGKSIFASAGCATCHTLAAAGATGTVGPNLDQAKPSLDLATERVTNGKGVMPSFKGQLTEAEIRAVAEFVSTSSRK